MYIIHISIDYILLLPFFAMLNICTCNIAWTFTHTHKNSFLLLLQTLIFTGSSQQHNCAIYIYQFVYRKSVLAQSTLGTRFTTNTSVDRSEYAKIHFKLFHVPSLSIWTINFVINIKITIQFNPNLLSF